MFLLKIKAEQNIGCPKKEHEAIFEHIYHKIKAYLRIPEAKKSALVNNTGKYYCILARF